MFAAPEEFALPRRVKGGWRIGEWDYEENPRFTVPGWANRLVHRWAETRRLAQSGGMMGGAVILPVAGGYGDQPALVMDAIALFDGWMAERKERDGGR